MELVHVGYRSSPRSCGQTNLRALCFYMYLVNSSGRPVSPGLELVGETYVVKVYGNPEVSCKNYIAVCSDFSTTKSKVLHQVIQCTSMRNYGFSFE